MRIVLAIALVMVLGRTANATPLELPKLGVTVDVPAAWTVDDTPWAQSALVTLGEPASLFLIVDDKACDPAETERPLPMPCPDGFVCGFDLVATVEVMTMCMPLDGPQGTTVFRGLVSTLGDLDDPDTASAVVAMLTATRDALRAGAAKPADVSKVITNVAHLESSGLDIEFRSSGQWLGTTADLDIGDGVRPTDVILRKEPAPAVAVAYQQLPAGANCDDYYAALVDEGWKYYGDRAWPDVAQRLYGGRIMRTVGEKAEWIHACVAVTSGHALVAVKIISDVGTDESYLPVVAAILKAAGAKPSYGLGSDEQLFRGMGKLWLAGGRISPEIDDAGAFGAARIGVDVVVPLGEGNVAPAISFGTSLGVDGSIRIAADIYLGFGIGAQLGGLRLYATAVAGADRNGPDSSFTFGGRGYLGATADAHIPLGIGALEVNAMWNTVEKRLAAGLALHGIPLGAGLMLHAYDQSTAIMLFVALTPGGMK